VSRSFANPSKPNISSHSFASNLPSPTPGIFGGRSTASRVTALSIEFVAKPNQAHNIQSALPAAINGAFGEVGGFAGGFVLIANYEARLVTVVTLWTGEDRMQRCNDNLKWLRALLNPYMDRCLRVQTLAAYIPEAKAEIRGFTAGEVEEPSELSESEAEAVCAA
jgi:hypothetical protein